MTNIYRITLIAMSMLWAIGLHAQGIQQTKGSFEDKFRQLDEVLPTANIYRNAGGAPGHEYWQQEVDYNIDATLDEDNQRLSATELITYRNNSPDTLTYLWFQLDQNRFRSDSMAAMSGTFNGSSPDADSNDPARISLGQLRSLQYQSDADLGHRINAVSDSRENALLHTVVGTLMRVDLAEPLESGDEVELRIDFEYNIVNGDVLRPRAGYEHFPDDEREGGNYIFALAQWFPRLVAYTDYEGWTNKEFLGSGEFTLEFGDYEVSMTVPADHIVSATGELQNPNDVLTREQRDRLREAESAQRPVYIVTPEEALENEAEGSNQTATWRFAAENVRDFAWSSSRKFIWDA
jgi:hypothetical protein